MKKLFLLLSAVFLSMVFLSVPTTLLAQNPTVSASKVTFRYCAPTAGSANVDLVDGDYYGTPLTETGTMVVTIPNARGCDSVVTLTVTDSLEGAILHAFSVSSTEKVYFSKGNLQYCAKPSESPSITHEINGGGSTPQIGILRFAEHQWDFVASSNMGNVYKDGVKCDNSLISNTYSGWIDLFVSASVTPYATSGYTTTTDGAVFARTSYDFGYYHAISNGGDSSKKWFTLTFDQWDYLLNTRPGAASKVAGATVNGVFGMILLPDVWKLPSGCSFSAKKDASVNVYTIAQWEKMESNGAVFLPMGGNYTTKAYRYGSNYNSNYSSRCVFSFTEAHYLTSTYQYSSSSYSSSSATTHIQYILFNPSSTVLTCQRTPNSGDNSYYQQDDLYYISQWRYSVRLVRYVYE